MRYNYIILAGILCMGSHTVSAQCTDEQIQGMQNAGITEVQIEKACKVDSNKLNLSGMYYCVFENKKSYGSPLDELSGADNSGYMPTNKKEYWHIQQTGDDVTIITSEIGRIGLTLDGENGDKSHRKKLNVTKFIINGNTVKLEHQGQKSMGFGDFQTERLRMSITKRGDVFTGKFERITKYKTGQSVLFEDTIHGIVTLTPDKREIGAETPSELDF